MLRDGSSVSCAFANFQLPQGFRQFVSTGRPELHLRFERSHQGGSEDFASAWKGAMATLAHAAQANAAACPQLAKADFKRSVPFDG